MKTKPIKFITFTLFFSTHEHCTLSQFFCPSIRLGLIFLSLGNETSIGLLLIYASIREELDPLLSSSKYPGDI